jgi:hypothetical protein
MRIQPRIIDKDFDTNMCSAFKFNISLVKGTVSRDNLYSIFFIHHILLVLLEVLYEDFKFRRIFADLFKQKGASPV